MQFTKPHQPQNKKIVPSPEKTGELTQETVAPESESQQTPSHVLQMQRTYGNQQTLKMLRRQVISPGSVIQRAASTWLTWAAKPLDQGGLNDTTGDNTFVDENGLVVVNGALDASDAFLEQALSTKTPKPLSEIVALAKKLKAADLQSTGLGQTDQDLLKKLQSSGGGRMRFRGVLGEKGKTGKGMVDTFVTKYLLPAYDNTLPDFLTNMTPSGRSRLYDLPNNATRGEKLHRDSIAWAVKQNPTSLSELVETIEYYCAMEDKIKSGVEERTNEAIEKAKLKPENTIEDDDVGIAPKARLLAKTDFVGKMNAAISGHFKNINQGKETSTVTGALAAVVVPDFGTYDLLAKLKNFNPLEATTSLKAIGVKGLKEAMGVIGDEVTSKDDFDWSRYKTEAKDKVQYDKIMQQKQTFVNQATAELEETLATNFTSDRLKVSETGYSDADVVIEGFDPSTFWSKSKDEQVDDIQNRVKVSGTHVPFFSSSAAVYHAEKHYSEIKDTVDRAIDTKTPLKAYLESATATVANASTTDVRTSQNQMGAHPSFFFKRKLAGAGSSPKDMLLTAILVVTDSGSIKLATYFSM